MKITRYTAIATAILLSCIGTFAQDFDDFGDFGDIGGGTSGGTSSAVSISGEAKIEARGYLDSDPAEKGINHVDGLKEIETSSNPSGKLNFKYSGSTVEAEVKLKFDRSSLTEYKEDILDEAIIRGIFMESALTVEAGKMRTIWGKGDRLHVIDNFNADNYTDFIVPLYSDRRIATPMLKTSYAFPKNNMVLEAIWTPGMTVDRFASKGRWVPGKVASMQGTIESSVKDNLAKIVEQKDTFQTQLATYTTLAESAKAAGNMEAAQMYGTAAETAKSNLANAEKTYLDTLNMATALSADSSSLYPDTNRLEYNQAGVRLTGTFGSVDLGASYYYGHYKQPSFNAKLFSAGDYKNMLAYDKKQTFGLEAATIFWKFNLRAEGCYNLTEDTAGDDPFVHNNSVQWLAGFDIDLPVSNINVNIQETGTLVLNNDKIDGAYKKMDVDYDRNDRYTTNHLVVNITDSWKNGKIEPEITALWSIERGDIVLMPKINFKPNQDITFTASGLFMNSKDEDGEFAEWSGKIPGNLNNSYIGLGVSCKF